MAKEGLPNRAAFFIELFSMRLFARHLRYLQSKTPLICHQARKLKQKNWIRRSL